MTKIVMSLLIFIRNRHLTIYKSLEIRGFIINVPKVKNANDSKALTAPGKKITD